MSAIKTETRPGRSNVATPASTRTARPQLDVEDIDKKFAGMVIRAKVSGPIEVFIHGSAPRNGQEGVNGAYACVFPDYLDCNSAQAVANGENPTGPRMSFLAAKLAIEIVKTAIDPTFERPLRIITNDENVTKSMTIWIKKWKTNGWKTQSKPKKPVANRDLIESIDSNPRKSIEWLCSEKDFMNEDEEEQQRVKMYHDKVVRLARDTAP